jgi:hypothetical protein
MEHGAMAQPDPELRRRVRRSALFWGAVAAAFYLGFIVLTLVRGAK